MPLFTSNTFSEKETTAIRVIKLINIISLCFHAAAKPAKSVARNITKPITPVLIRKLKY